MRSFDWAITCRVEKISFFCIFWYILITNIAKIHQKNPRSINWDTTKPIIIYHISINTIGAWHWIICTFKRFFGGVGVHFFHFTAKTLVSPQLCWYHCNATELVYFVHACYPYKAKMHAQGIVSQKSFINIGLNWKKDSENILWRQIDSVMQGIQVRGGGCTVDSPSQWTKC